MANLRTSYSNAFNEDAPLESNHSDLFITIHEKEWARSMYFIKTRPQEAREWSTRMAMNRDIIWKKLPIHEACINNAPVFVISALLKAFPESRAALDLNERLPLHHAVIHGADFKVIELLLKCFPSSVNVLDKFHKSPAICFQSFNKISGNNVTAYNQMIEALSASPHDEAVKTFGPDCQTHGDKDCDLYFHENDTCLMRAITNKIWDEALELIAEQSKSNYIEASEWTTHRDSDGDIVWRRLPIHEACINNAPANVVEALIEAHQEGVRESDLTNRLPLHHTAVHGLNINVIEMLLAAYPESIEAKDIFGKTPIRCLKSPAHSDSSMYYSALEALSKTPDFYYKKGSPVRSAPAVTEHTLHVEQIEKLQNKLEREQWENVELNRKLEEMLSRTQFLEEMMLIKSRENENLKNSLNSLKREYTKLEMDVLSQGSVLSYEDRDEVESVAYCERPVDSIVIKDGIVFGEDKNLKNLKEGMKVKDRKRVALERAISPRCE